LAGFKAKIQSLRSSNRHFQSIKSQLIRSVSGGAIARETLRIRSDRVKGEGGPPGGDKGLL
jgi:hypothetical protein